MTGTTTETTLEAKPGAKGNTTNLTDSKDHIVDSINNCKLRTDNADKALSFLSNILDFTDLAVDLTNRTKPTDA
jgi:hypothetical protein